MNSNVQTEMRRNLDGIFYNVEERIGKLIETEQLSLLVERVIEKNEGEA